jgi:hypothetical protein
MYIAFSDPANPLAAAVGRGTGHGAAEIKLKMFAIS